MILFLILVIFFEVVDIRQLDEKTWEISNPNYILFLEKIQEE